MRPPCWTLPVLLSCCSLQFVATVKQKTDHRLYIEVTSSDFQELEASHVEDSDLRNLSHAQGTSKTHQGTEKEQPVSVSAKPTQSSLNKARDKPHIESIKQHRLQLMTTYKRKTAEELWISPFGMADPEDGDTLSFSRYYMGVHQLFGLGETKSLVEMDVGQILRLRTVIIGSFADALSQDKRESVQTVWKPITNSSGVAITEFPMLEPESFDPSLAQAGVNADTFGSAVEGVGVELSFDEFKVAVQKILGQVF